MFEPASTILLAIETFAMPNGKTTLLISSGGEDYQERLENQQRMTVEKRSGATGLQVGSRSGVVFCNP
jgi:hypothetical protein